MPDEVTELTGVIEDVSVHIPETGFTVFELESGDEFITVVGVMPELSPGEKITVRGTYSNHSIYGRQFRAESYSRSLPTGADDLYRYLASGAIKGVGPVTARNIITLFGEDAFEVMESRPEELARIKGISPSRARAICEEFSSQFAVRQVLIALERFGMTGRECTAVYKVFGISSIERVRQNPYVLCSEEIGLSFERADMIASQLPEAPESVYRQRAGLMHVLRHNLGNGHTCLPKDKVAKTAAPFLDITEEEASAVLDTLVEDSQLEREIMDGREFLFLPYIHRAEKQAADRIKVLCAYPPAGRQTLLQDVENIERELCITYEQKQKLAIITAVEKGVLILTGGPGTGKTTAINGMIRLFKKDGLNIALAAPTGRAAKRMSEITGMEAKTIHRLLEVEWDESDRPEFKRNERNPLNCNALIVDELSMIDVLLFSSLLKALPLGCRLVMVGDSDQLPPVGSGNVLHDLIDSGRLPVVELNEVFRQAQRSLIVTNAHRIVKGVEPQLDRKDGDFFFLPRLSADKALSSVCELTASRLPKAFGYSPFTDIQVLCPSKKGTLGTFNLNRALQQAVNPPSPDKRELTVGMFLFREGDKIMHVKNNYDLQWKKADGEVGEGVFNGDIGRITEISSAGGVKIDFDDGRSCLYDGEAMREVELAYAVTVHKSQGNEFDAVIIPLLNVTENLGYRNLLYTAVTRARKLLIIVGDEAQVGRMTRNDKKALRYSALKYFLKEGENDA